MNDPDLTVSVDRSELAAAVSIASQAVPKVAHDDRLLFQGGRLTHLADRLHVTATGPEMSIETHVPLYGPPRMSRQHAPAPRRPGPAESDLPEITSVVPIGVLSRLVPRLKAGEVRLGLRADRLDVESGRFRGSLKGWGRDGLILPLPPVEPRLTLRVGGSDIRDALAHVSLALSSDLVWTRGIQALSVTLTAGGDLRLVATDRYHLAIAICRDVEVHGGASMEETALIPAGAVQVLAGLAGTDDDVVIEFGSDQTDVRIGDTTVRLTSVPGPIPDHRRMTDLDPTHRITLTRRTLATVVRRVGVMAHGQRRAIWLELDPTRAVARADDGEVGQARERFPALVTGEQCEIGIGLPVLLVMVRRLADGRVVVGFDRTDKIASIHSEERPDLRYYTTLLAVRPPPWLASAEAGHGSA